MDQTVKDGRPQCHYPLPGGGGVGRAVNISEERVIIFICIQFFQEEESPLLDTQDDLLIALQAKR